MNSSELRPPPASAPGSLARARSVGPAAAAALSRDRAGMRVHSVFASTMNLEVEGEACLISMGGPGSWSSPLAVALDSLEDLTGAALQPGDQGRIEACGFWLSSRRGGLSVDCSRASFPAPQAMPLLPRVPAVWGSCAALLAEIQERRGCDLRMEFGQGSPPPHTELQARLRWAAFRLGEAVEAAAARDHQPMVGQPGLDLDEALSDLVGLGAGATPSGDDFLCGFLAAACARSQDSRPPAWLSEGITRHLPSTSRLGGSLLGWAMRGHWPSPLVAFARALASGPEGDAARALSDLCALGHSSGADMGTGFLSGLEHLAGDGRAPP